MKKTTVQAPANIAFIKYWAKSDPRLRVPKNNSISMNLSSMFSLCTVEFAENLSHDDIAFVGEKKVTEREIKRIVTVLDRIRKLAGSTLYARVRTKNNFPKATGIASSASGFASLTYAATRALGLVLDEKELSRLSRLASGTACRSIPDGFVEWVKGTGSHNSYAVSLYKHTYWSICDVVVVVSKTMKKVSSTDGHALAHTSPFYKKRLKDMDRKISRLKKAMKEKDFRSFGRLVEDEALNMHAICFTSTPPIIYWEPATVKIIKRVAELRKNGIECYVTIDAGPSVHVISKAKDAQTIKKTFSQTSGVLDVVINTPAKGAHIVKTHLF